MKATCKCGKREYLSEELARFAEPNGSHKCPECGTFALAHPWECNGDEDCNRCAVCDTRLGSHGGPAYFA